jgi:hypothetical protein
VVDARGSDLLYHRRFWGLRENVDACLGVHCRNHYTLHFRCPTSASLIHNKQTMSSFFFSSLVKHHKHHLSLVLIITHYHRCVVACPPVVIQTFPLSHLGKFSSHFFTFFSTLPRPHCPTRFPESSHANANAHTPFSLQRRTNKRNQNRSCTAHKPGTTGTDHVQCVRRASSPGAYVHCNSTFHLLLFFPFHLLDDCDDS